MSSIFARYELTAQSVHENIFGEGFVFIPKMRGLDVNSYSTLDNSRQQVTVIGIYREKDIDFNIKDAADVYGDHKPGVSAHTHVIEIDPRTQNIEPKTLDILTRVSDGSVWEIVSTDPDSMGRVKCNVRRIR